MFNFISVNSHEQQMITLIKTLHHLTTCIYYIFIEVNSSEQYVLKEACRSDMTPFSGQPEQGHCSVTDTILLGSALVWTPAQLTQQQNTTGAAMTTVNQISDANITPTLPPKIREAWKKLRQQKLSGRKNGENKPKLLQ